MSTDDAFEPYWLDEKEWLVTICMLPDDDEGDADDNLQGLNWIGRLFGFAYATNTRMLALMGDPDMPTYEILFSFDTPEHRQEFLELVRHDGYADPDEEGTFMVPSHDEIKDARPIGLVFPEEQAQFFITTVGMITFEGLNTNTGRCPLAELLFDLEVRPVLPLVVNEFLEFLHQTHDFSAIPDHVCGRRERLERHRLRSLVAQNRLKELSQIPAALCRHCENDLGNL